MQGTPNETGDARDAAKNEPAEPMTWLEASSAIDRLTRNLHTQTDHLDFLALIDAMRRGDDGLREEIYDSVRMAVINDVLGTGEANAIAGRAVAEYLARLRGQGEGGDRDEA